MDAVNKMKWLIYVKLLFTLAISVCKAEVFTSIEKIENMVLREEGLLHDLHQDLSNLGDHNTLSHFSRFYSDRITTIKQRNPTQLKALKEDLKHPNGVYYNIKEFAQQYRNIRYVLGSTSSNAVHARLSEVADDADVEGAKLSYIRLQEVYGLKPSDMAKGNFSGFQGPVLNAMDCLDIAKIAFTAFKLKECEAWLEAALDQLRPEPGGELVDNTQPYRADILGLLGRVYVRVGRAEEATAVYKRSVGLPVYSGDLGVLRQELPMQFPKYDPQLDEKARNFSRLCSLQSKLSNGNKDPRLRCTYRVIRPAYNRFKMELLSISPYVAIYHEVITDEEINHFMGLSKPKMYRGVYQVETGLVGGTGDFRVSDVGWLYNSDSAVVEKVGKRVALITGLNTSQESAMKFGGEPFQLVNYGMGGHYGIHTDNFVKELTGGIHENGNRMATFLIYLSHVEKGGSTAFTQAELVVPPMKKSALFWYTSTPNGEIDELTHHAGCPVIVGNKWVTNKWVWTNENMFVRRCGRRPNSTQMDIQKYMLRGWK